MDCPKCSGKLRFEGEDGKTYCSACGFKFADTFEDLWKQTIEAIKSIGWTKITTHYSQGIQVVNFERDKFALHLEFGEKADVFGEEE